MSSDPLTTRTPTPRRFVLITRTVHPSKEGYFLDAIADDGTAWHLLYSPPRGELGWRQHPPLPPIS